MKLKLALIALLASTSAQAASTGTLFISGTVAAVNDIVITANPNAITLNVVGGESGKSVASVEEKSNNLAGYKIELSSTNASKLVHGTDATKSTGYTLSYGGGAPVTLTTSPQTVKSVSSLSGLTTTSSDVSVSVTAFPTAPAGTYTDTVTISIVAN